MLRRAFADGSVSLSELRGRAVMLNFWASWCPPCRTETPRLERAWKTASADGVLFLGVSMQDISSDAREFVDDQGVTYPNVRDGDGDTARAWGVTGLPETFFIRKDGRVVAHVIGEITGVQLSAASRRPGAARSRARCEEANGDRRASEGERRDSNPRPPGPQPGPQALAHVDLAL